MQEALNDPRVFFNYLSKYREYYINTDEKMIVHLITHCPWCGKKLPKSLREEWFNILSTEYNINHPRDEDQEQRIPKEFKSDEWWKKRKL